MHIKEPINNECNDCICSLLQHQPIKHANQPPSISCAQNESLIACSTYSYHGYTINGGCPELNEFHPILLETGTLQLNNTKSGHDHICISETGHGSIHGVYAKAICAETNEAINIQCTSIYDESTSDVTWSNLSCPSSHPIMTSCQAISDYMNWDQVYIADNQCKSHKIDNHTHATVAIWYV